MYRLIGRLAVPCSNAEDWIKAMHEADWPKNKDASRVGLTTVEPLHVSTVFIWLDHAWEGEPQLFETMIFGDCEDNYQERCSTWDQAEQMHAKAVAFATELVRKSASALAELDAVRRAGYGLPGVPKPPEGDA